MASDAKWYPPHLHPSSAPPPPPPVDYPPGYGPPPGYGYPAGGQGGPTAVVRIDAVLRQPLAPWWKRLVAILIDGAILSSAGAVILITIGAVTSHGNTSTSSNSNATAGQIVAGTLLLWILASAPIAVYYGIMNGSSRGQTVGKMALGIAVRDARTGRPLGFWRAVGRYLITMVFTIVLLIPAIIDALTPLWNVRNQSWHDMVARSIVIDLRP